MVKFECAYMIWSEWDLGFSHKVFACSDKAWKYIEENFDEGEVGMSLDECIEGCLIGLTDVEMVW